MPSKYYAVVIGRDGPAIYDNVDDYRAATQGLSASSGKSFDSRHDAKAWLNREIALIQQSFNRYATEGGRGIRRVMSPDMDTPETPPKRVCRPDPAPPAQQNVVEPIITGPVGLPPAEPGIQLSPEQQYVLDQVKSGKNVFFTGPAGTGKSVLLREIIKWFKSGTLADQLAITASTGIAGLNIGGSTVHSFAGIGLGKEPTDQLIEEICSSKRRFERWASTKALIVDEISMLDGILFDKLEAIACAVEDEQDGPLDRPPKPFGGIQLILSGDFCQLPPVPDQSHAHSMPATFAFDAQSWSRCISKPILLSQVFRQRDNAFIQILSAMRVGHLSLSHIKQLERLSRPLVYNDGIEPSELYPLKAEVESCNNKRLNALSDPSYTYLAMDSAGHDVSKRPIDDKDAERLLERLVAPLNITLKVGAQVMLLRNVVQGSLVNGSVGKITEFMTTHEALKRSIEIARDSNNPERANDRVRRNPPPDPLPDFNVPSRIGLRRINENVFHRDQRWPLVQFTGGRELLCAPLEFTVEGFLGNLESHRLQVPLILAWALSIHKSQGQTLSRVKVNLRRIFEKGQAYVALSRATSMEGLQVVDFHPARVQAHPRVLAWQAQWMPQLNDPTSFTASQSPTNDENHSHDRAGESDGLSSKSQDTKEVDVVMDVDELDSEEAIMSYPWDQSDPSF